MSTQSFVGLLCLVAACLLCGTIEPARGLECYKSTWSDPSSLTLNTSSTTVCDKPAAFRIKRDDPPAPDASAPGDTTVAPGDTTVAPADGSTPASNATAGGDYYCFTATVNNDTLSVGVERGCKSGSKEDDCLTLDNSKYPNAKVDKCTTCNSDKCNDNSASTLLTVSLHCAFISSVMIVKALTKISV